MDFIKTSSLRALIELTFQRNWNGLIWMRRNGVTTKRVKTAPDGSLENQRPTAQSGSPRNERSTLGQKAINQDLISETGVDLSNDFHHFHVENRLWTYKPGIVVTYK
ncbi:unnamed protein product [Microthlaspi erraticum]|uniref:Uncharacterized protein n=1 Tax=Microthlaspi erraticum TaxID=1685480 RepID=A0A6D2JQ71_9BRAS|nr:unnamed protein product [Microthlaspi erraticum]